MVIDDKGACHEAKAQIGQNKVLLKTSVRPDRIKKIRYLVSYTYSGAMIYNRANLPMGPFELDVEK